MWSDFPGRTQLITHITPHNIQSVSQALGGSASVDVTGGMEGKVRQMVSLVEENPGLDVLIFSGEKPGNVEQALLGQVIGTIIQNE